MNETYIFLVFLNEVRIYGRQPDGTLFKAETAPSIEDFAEAKKDDQIWKSSDIGLVFSPTFTRNERARAEQTLRHSGFESVEQLDFDQRLIDMVAAHNQALIMSADGDDLFMSLYNVGQRQLVALKKFKGMGKDPRVKVLAEKIWQQIIDETPYLNKATGLPVVAKVAAKFILSGKSEETGSVILEGESRDYFITRHDLDITNNIDQGGSSLLTAFSTFCETAKVEKSDCILILSYGLGGNPYFENLLNGVLSDTLKVDKKLRESILSELMNGLGGVQAKSACGIIADELPADSIHATVNERSISFHIDFPSGIDRIEVLRDGKHIRTITSPDFTDSGLEFAHEYAYTFIIISVSEDGVVARSRGMTRKFTTTTIVVDAPEPLKIKDEGKSVVVSWKQSGKNEVRVFVSEKPFPYHINDHVDLANFPYEQINTIDTSFSVAKDFCGERFYMPVSVEGSTGIVGDQSRIQSTVLPSGVRIDSTSGGHVRVIWTWTGIPAVRIRWKDEFGGCDAAEILQKDSPEPEFELPLSSRARELEVAVSSFFVSSEGDTIESEKVNLHVKLKPAKINFLEVKKPSLFKRNIYTLTLQAESVPPCDIYVLIEEGNVPMNLIDYHSYMTIPLAELTPGTAKSFKLEYHRSNKSVPLYFRIIAADRNRPVVIIPETMSVK